MSNDNGTNRTERKVEAKKIFIFPKHDPMWGSKRTEGGRWHIQGLKCPCSGVSLIRAHFGRGCGDGVSGQVGAAGRVWERAWVGKAVVGGGFEDGREFGRNGVSTV